MNEVQEIQFMGAAKDIIGKRVKYYVDSPAPDPRSGKEIELLEYPAIVYKVITWDTTHEYYYVGLYAFTDTGIRHMRSVSFSKDPKHDTWRD